VHYPFAINRGETWTVAAPGEREPVPVVVPDASSLDFHDVVVPASWFISGEDHPSALPRQRVWCDAFVMRRHPVRVGEFAPFAASTGRGDAFAAQLDGDPELPMTGVDYATAVAFAKWEATRTGEAWRLPCELEWEKAARGVDGRPYPWGDQYAPRWCRAAESVAQPSVARVDVETDDVSPYGVQGLAGNVRAWCSDEWKPNGRPLVGRWVQPGGASDPGASRVIRGGSWRDVGGAALFERRFAEPDSCVDDLGIRLVRTL
jgi:serine/threonine-protein kinase